MSRKAVGNSGEADAAQFLESQNFRIVARNVRPLPGMARGEIDIIAWDGDILCFIEVKTRKSLRSEPAENVTPAKQRQIVLLTEAWLSLNDVGGAQVRFDVVSVHTGNALGGSRIVLMRDAFRPE